MTVTVFDVRFGTYTRDRSPAVAGLNMLALAWPYRFDGSTTGGIPGTVCTAGWAVVVDVVVDDDWLRLPDPPPQAASTSSVADARTAPRRAGCARAARPHRRVRRDAVDQL